MSLAAEVLNESNYYADRHYMSASRLKGYLECAARQYAIDNGEWVEEPTEAMLAGSYVHAVMDGTIEQFKALHTELFNKKGELYAPYRQADDMAQSLLNDSFICSMLVGKHEHIITTNLYGVPWKAKIDVLHTARIVDVKTVAKLTDRDWSKEHGRYMSWVESRGYLRQLAIYAEAVRLATDEDEWRQPLIVAVTKEDPPDKAVIAIDDATIQEELEKVRLTLPFVMNMVNGILPPTRCEHCKYCRSTKQVKRIVMWQDLTV